MARNTGGVQVVDLAGALSSGLQIGQNISAKIDAREIADREREMDSVIQGSLEIQGRTPQEQVAILGARVQKLQNEGRDPKGSIQMIEDLASGDPERINIVNSQIDKNIEFAERTGKLKQAQQVKPVKRTSLQENLIAGGLTPGTPEFEQAVQKSIFKPATQVNIGGERTEQKELAKIGAQRFAKVQDSGELAQQNIASLDVLDSIDVSTGQAEPMKQALASWGQALGVDTSKLANVPAGQAFTAEASKVVLNAMAAQKGPQTESDMKQIRTTVANLKNDPRANQFINNTARSLEMRKIEQRDFYENYLDARGTLKGVGKAWNENKRSVPLISKKLKDKNGLPVFFFRFEESVRNANEAQGQSPTREEIIQEWKRLDKKRK